MELYFLRHGIAAVEGPAGSGDAGRPLTEQGSARMRKAARSLRLFGVQPDALLSSPLVRARQTAEIVARELGLEVRLADALAPGCDLAQLQGLLDEQRGAQRYMLVGHEPDFSTLVGDLTGGSRVLLKKGGLARVDLDAVNAGAGVLVWLIPPRFLRLAG